LVIVKGTEYYDGALKRYVDFPITDVLQMMGRAGRPQFDTSAEAVVMVHEPKKNFYKKFIYEPFPVESSLHEQLTDHLNAEIVAKTIRTRDGAIDYVTWTYFFRRLTANPAYYDQQAALLEEPSFEKQRDMLANYIERLMNKCLDELIRSGCIQLKPGIVSEPGTVPSAIVEATKIGRIASLYYLGHRTVAQFQRTLAQEGKGFVEIMKILCECPEYDELPVRHNEDKLNAEFAERLCPLEVDLAIQAYDSPHTKAYLLLQAHMWDLPLPINDYKTDMKSVLDRSIPLIQAMVDIAAEEGQLKSTTNLIILLQCLHQATHPWRSSLSCLPHVTQRILSKLQGMGIDCIPELIERDSINYILTQLGLPTAEAHRELLKLLSELPKLRMRVELRVLETEEQQAVLRPEEKSEALKAEVSRDGKQVLLTKLEQGQDDKEDPGQVLHVPSGEQPLGPWIADELERQVGRRPVAVVDPSGKVFLRGSRKKPGELLPAPKPGEAYLVPPDRELELTVVMRYVNDPMKYVHAPRFPKKKTYSWWCMLGDLEVDELVAIKKALMPARRNADRRVNFQFCAPSEDVGETFTLSVLCMSDSWFGLDQQVDIAIKTANV
jgi:hypothetical protein